MLLDKDEAGRWYQVPEGESREIPAGTDMGRDGPIGDDVMADVSGYQLAPAGGKLRIQRRRPREQADLPTRIRLLDILPDLA